MIYYWYRLFRILIGGKFQKKLSFEDVYTRSYRVGVFDCEGLRVMTSHKYFVYMDFIRWEMIARTNFFNAIVKKRLAPILGSQKIIHKKPIKLGTKFNVKLETVGWDDKWLYCLHTFEQNGTIMAVGVTKGLVWKKDEPQALMEVLINSGVTNLNKKTPDWVLQLFDNDKNILSNTELN